MVEHLIDIQGVTGSNPVSPTIKETMTFVIVSFILEITRVITCQGGALLSSSASERSAEVFCLEQTKFAKTKTEDTFNANEQDNPVSPTIKKESSWGLFFHGQLLGF